MAILICISLEQLHKKATGALITRTQESSDQPSPPWPDHGIPTLLGLLWKQDRAKETNYWLVMSPSASGYFKGGSYACSHGSGCIEDSAEEVLCKC